MIVHVGRDYGNGDHVSTLIYDIAHFLIFYTNNVLTIDLK